MRDVAENGSYTEPRRGPPRAWGWLFAPDGRMGRVDYFYAVLARVFAIALPMAFLSPDMTAAVPVWTIAVILTAGGPTARRFHDLDLSGLHGAWLCFSLALAWTLNDQLARPLVAANAFFYVLSWIPYLLVLALMLWPGGKTANRYGQPPPPSP